MLNESRIVHRSGYAAIVALGILTILGSESVEKDDTPPAPPVTTIFEIVSLAAPLEVDRGEIAATITNLRMAGDYEAPASDRLTLDRDFVTLDDTTTFDAAVRPANPDDLRTGSVSLTIKESWDFAPGRDPLAGRLSTEYAGTTTIVRSADNLSGAGITVGADEIVLSWDDFRGAVDDDGDALDVRMASLAYRLIGDLYDTALRAETVERDVDANRANLEGVGVNEPINVDCDGVSTGDTGQRTLIWKADAADSGGGSIGNGDEFEVEYDNCRLNARDETLHRTLSFDNYLLDDSEPKTLRLDAEFSRLFAGAGPISNSTQPNADLPSYSGGISLTYEQQAAPPVSD